MTARDADQPEPRSGFEPVNPFGDVIESGAGGPARRLPTIGAGLALVLVGAAALAGYQVGRHHPLPAAKPSASAPPVVAQPLAATGKQCSAQLGDRLQLGVEIVNQSPAAMTLRQVQAILPLNGLRATATTWGGCGQLPAAAVSDVYPLPAGATSWLTITFDVLVRCPAPLPVQFSVHYDQAGGPGTADLPGFADLGGVPYTPCPSGSS